MKYLEEPQLSWLNSVLGNYEIGDRVLNAKLETYSCKKAGSDKRLAKSLELYYQQEIEAAADLLGSSPLGPIAAPATRKLLINLISTMNASFPDYDFSAVKPEQFRKEPDFRIALQRVNHDLAELLEAQGNGFVEKMWEAIAEAITLEECDVYSYIPDMDSDPFSDGLCARLTYESDMDDETMDEPADMDDDGEDAMEDYFGMSPDWYVEC
ncbi:unnamed protein product [Phytophthora lilii]|uniref:Unnamed protein product n=1 Tax=Phytophthora lilii TaxID=2077276 RepID=A0A9W7DAA0_9STRA|nr:unnamed protein product [Phytophthora lilii]